MPCVTTQAQCAFNSSCVQQRQTLAHIEASLSHRSWLQGRRACLPGAGRSCSARLSARRGIGALVPRRAKCKLQSTSRLQTAAGSGPGKSGSPGAKPVAALLASLFLTGAVWGPLLDGIHGQVQLLEYDKAQLELGGLHSSWSVVVLLGAFYAVVGGAIVALDAAALGTRTASGASAPVRALVADRTVSPIARASLPRVLLGAGSTAALLQLSAVLYSSGVPYPAIHAALAVCALGCWAAFDGSLQGALLSSVVALAAPFASEIVLMRLGLWHYPRPDVFIAGAGVVSWVMWCYFAYTSALSLLARWTWRRLNQPDAQAE